MSENRKFAALAELRQQHTTELGDSSPSVVLPLPKGKPGRPAGKRSDASFKPTTVLLRRETKKMANRKLEDTNSTQDLSDLLEQLLSNWIKNS